MPRRYNDAFEKSTAGSSSRWLFWSSVDSGTVVGRVNRSATCMRRILPTHTHTHTHTHTDQTTIGCTYVCVWDGSVCRIPGYSAVGSDWVLERLQTDAPNKRSRVSPQQKNEWTLSQKVHCLSRGGLLATRRRVWPCVCVWPCGRVAVWPCGRVCVFFACTHTHPQESTGGCSRKCRDSRAS